MTDEIRKELMQNCLDGLQSLNSVLDILLIDSELHQDEKLLSAKKEVEQHVEILSSKLDTLNDKKTL